MSGRPQGDLAVLWHKNSPFEINTIVTFNDFIAFNDVMNNFQIALVNIYIYKCFGGCIDLK